MEEKKKIQIESIDECINALRELYDSETSKGRKIVLGSVLLFLTEDKPPEFSIFTPAGQVDQMIRMFKTHGYDRQDILDILKGSKLL